MLNPEALLRGETIDNVVDRILTRVKIPVDIDDAGSSKSRS
jgi:hypothetical protein